MSGHGTLPGPITIDKTGQKLSCYPQLSQPGSSENLAACGQQSALLNGRFGLLLLHASLTRPLNMTKPRFPTPEDAERAFYDAFENADLRTMMYVWADSECIECIHPMAKLIQGRDAVSTSWEQIFASDIEITLTLTTIQRTKDVKLAVHLVHEHLSVPDRSEQYPPVIATNVYQLIDNNWRMVLHHASPSSREDHENKLDTSKQAAELTRLH